MTILDSIKDYISTCPHLKLFNDAFVDITVDYSQSDQVATYSINETICNPIIKTYVDGTSERQFLFTFNSVEYFGSDVAINIANIGFYETFSEWLLENSMNGVLPTMGEGKEPTKIKALTCGYLFDNQQDASKARYTIQCQLIYDQE